MCTDPYYPAEHVLRTEPNRFFNLPCLCPALSFFHNILGLHSRISALRSPGVAGSSLVYCGLHCGSGHATSNLLVKTSGRSCSRFVVETQEQHILEYDYSCYAYALCYAMHRSIHPSQSVPAASTHAPSQTSNGNTSRVSPDRYVLYCTPFPSFRVG